ncbi:MAG TPA: phosphotransferase [Armatimonadaceae bacterium]|nr:phosphotransferase [Armatimonadaceae bacterium]
MNAAAERRLARYVTDRYGLAAPVACRLLRTYTNDVYAVTSAAGERFVLKVYGAGWRTESEIRYEAALLAHLATRGLSVSAPVVRADGDVLGQAASDDDPPCWAVLFPYAPGEKPRPPFSGALYERFGEAVARMHALSDDFATEHPRRALDLAYLIDEPLARVAPLLATAPDDRDYLLSLAARARERVAALDAGGLDRGPIHGDASLDNLHVTPDGVVTLFDFDSGGPGWRAADLQGWAAPPGMEHRANWDAFHRGYASVRTLRPADLLAAPWLTLAVDIWGIRVDLDRRVLGQGRERAEAFARERVRALREREQALFPRG